MSSTLDVPPAIMDAFDTVDVPPAIMDAFDTVDVPPAILDAFDTVDVHPAILDAFDSGCASRFFECLGHCGCTSCYLSFIMLYLGKLSKGSFNFSALIFR